MRYSVTSPYDISPSVVPVGVDPNRASIARVYDAALGGKTNYAVDREVLDAAMRVHPGVAELAWANRNFLTRVMRHLAGHVKIRQYLDCGSGLPTAENTHQIAQRFDRSASVVYVDNDPVVLAHGRALLATNDATHILDANIFEPDQVLNHDLVTTHLDFDEPIAVLLLSVMHHHLDTAECARIVRRYADALPADSYLALSHLIDPETPGLTPVAKGLEQVALNSKMGSGTFRTRAEIETLTALDGYDMLPPGPGEAPAVVACDRWWPDGPVEPLTPTQECFAGVVLRKR
ncbi:SAM-dependent methyltransferase [Prauserella marina]|uniref:SAM-dependent methyltransferase n=2 Tax=Prauserella marina TaxID=530584 RepID=UPI00201119C7|nr:SAM-dependent methyltransferase [Prauserella marina]